MVLSRVSNALSNVERESTAGNRHSTIKKRLLGVTALVALALATCFAGLRTGPPLGGHESINALAARQAMQSGRWLVPQLDGTPRIRKTPLGIWLIGAASYLTGHLPGSPPVTQFSARLPSAVAGAANVLVVFWLGVMLFGYRCGLTAGFVCAGCAATVIYSRNAQVDMVLTFFTTLAFACFWRGAMHQKPSKWAMTGFYAAFALAMLAKAPLPLATVGLALGVYWFFTVPILEAGRVDEQRHRGSVRRWIAATWMQVSHLKRLRLLSGIVIFLLAVGAWPVYVAVHVDGAVALWRIEYLDRFTGEMSSKVRPAWYYVPIMFGLTVPFMLSLPAAVAAPFTNRYASYRRGLAFAFTWAAVGTLFLSASAFKRPHYLLSVVPAYCLLLAPVVERVFFGPMSIASRAVRTVCYSAPVLLAVAGVAGGVVLERQYPALLKPYVLASSAAFLVWAAAGGAYLRARRVLAFAFFNLGVPIMVVIMWPAVGNAVDFNAEGGALVRAFHEHGIGPNDEIYWADKRPNASIEFYSGLRLRRLIGENEMAGLRRTRRTVSRAVYEEVARRIVERLHEEHPVFIILRASRYRMLERTSDVATRVLFRLHGFHKDPGDELVVFTQQASLVSPKGE